MPGGLTPITQDSFAAGLFQAPDTQHIPANGSYDIVNGLIDSDQGLVYRRGGATYKGTAAPGTLLGIRDVQLAAGQRTLMYTSSGLYQFAANDSTPTVLPPVFTSLVPSTLPIFRMALIQGLVAIPIGVNGYPDVTLYGGSLKSASYSPGSGGTWNVDVGSRSVTASGTAYLANVDPGMILVHNGANPGEAIVAAIKSVDSDTTLTLANPWPGPDHGRGDLIQVAAQVALDTIPQWGPNLFVANASNRLAVGDGPLVRFSAIANPWTFATTDYHALPDGAAVTGLQPVRGMLLVFSTAGTYVISNIGLDLTDASGNPQQQLNQISSDLILWADPGIASWKEAAIVPAVDDIYLLDGVSSPVSIGGAVRGLYRQYVAAGYTLGLAHVFRGHYILPILNGTTWVDTLVCQLSTGAWTRLAGQGGSCLGYTSRIATGSARQPVLFGVNGTRVLNCTGWFTPTAANKNDADGSTHSFSLITRDFSTSNVRAMFKKLRLWIEGVDAGTDAPTLTAGVAEGLPGTSFTGLSGTACASTGDTPAGKFDVNVGGKRVRFQIASSSPWASLKIKALDVFVRPKGRA